jgi:hypothetical protein
VLTNRWVPLALNVLAPIALNILLFHLFVDSSLLPLALLLTVLESVLLWTHIEIILRVFSHRRTWNKEICGVRRDPMEGEMRPAGHFWSGALLEEGSLSCGGLENEFNYWEIWKNMEIWFLFEEMFVIDHSWLQWRRFNTCVEHF